MTEVQALKVAAALIAAFRTTLYGITPDEARVMAATYADGLKDLDFEVVDEAVRRLNRTAKKLPLISDIRDAVVILTRGQARTGLEGWADFKGTLGLPPSATHKALIGARGEGIPAYADPIVDAVVRALGWNELRESENAIADRARFIEAYDQLARQGRDEAKASDRAAGAALPSRGRSPALPPASVVPLPRKLAQPTIGDAAPFSKPKGR